MKKRVSFLLVVMLVVVLLAGCSKPGGKDEADKSVEYPSSIIIASGPIGGPWYSSCTKISEILMREIPGLNVSVTEGGAEGNLELLEIGQDAQLGVTSSVALQQLTDGTGRITLKNVSGFMPIVTSYIQAAVLEDSEITSYKDVLGKKISAGKVGFASELIFRETLEAYGITYEDIESAGGKINYLSWGEYPDMMGDGHLDVVCLNGEVPHNIYMQLEASKPLRMLSIDPKERDMVLEKMPSLFTKVFPAGVYKGTKDDFEMFAYSGILCASKEMPDEFLIEILNIIQDNKEEIINELKFVDLLGWENADKGLSEDVCRESIWKLIQSKQSN